MDPDDQYPEIDASPCERVRSTCLAWFLAHEDVTLNESAVPLLCSEIIEQQTSFAWDAEGWHYAPPNHWPQHIRLERIALYILALDAINFCFWPDPDYEYEDLAATLSSIASQDHDDPDVGQSTSYMHKYALAASNLLNMSSKAMRDLFVGHHRSSRHPPDIEKRCELWNEIGAGLVSKFDGSAMNFVSQAASSAPRLVYLLLCHFPGFRDYSSEKDVWFLKRAQICVGDLNAALELGLSDDHRLTTFADYRIPQLLREYQVLKYSDSLSSKVDRGCELEAGGQEECSIRAATVIAVDKIVQELRTRKESLRSWTAIEADWVLWQMGERTRKAMRPHHKVRTTFY